MNATNVIALANLTIIFLLKSYLSTSLLVIDSPLIFMKLKEQIGICTYFIHHIFFKKCK